MGDLQKKILGHMLECTSELENTNHISKALGLAQPTIFKSIRLLEKEKYVQTRQENPHGIRTLKLTDKGVASALFAGEEKDKIYSYLERRAPSSTLLLLMNIVKDKYDLNSDWMRLFIEHMLCQEQELNESDEKKKVELIATLIAGPKNGFVDARKLRRHLERDEIFWLTVMLRNKITSTNSLIDQLTSEEPNEAKPKPEIILSRKPFKTTDKWHQIKSEWDRLTSEEPNEAKPKPEIICKQLNFANITTLKSMIAKLYSTPAKIQKDTIKELEVYIYWNELSKFLKAYIQSDQLRLQVNKADGEMSITPIPKSTR